MTVAALVWKELRHHAIAGMGAALLIGAAAALVLLFGMLEVSGSVMADGVNTVYFVLPAVAAWSVRRAFVLERLDGTHAFLASLPIAPATRIAVKYALALGVTWVGTLVVLGITGSIARQSELVPVGWLARITLQSLLYTWGWLAVFFAVAHLGRWRSVAWVVLIVVALFLQTQTLDGRLPPWQLWTWHGVLYDPTDSTRYAPPWREVPVAALWIAGATATGFILGAWRSGLLAEVAFRRAFARDRGIGAAFVLWGFVVLDVASLWVERAATTGLPAVGASLRAGGTRVLPLATVLAVDLEGLDPSLSSERRSEVTLVPMHRADRTIAATWISDGVLAIDVESPVEARAQALTQLLGRRGGGWAWRDPQRSALLPGVSRYRMAPRSDAEPWASRAALAGGVSAEDLADGISLRERLGRDVADAVAWVGIITLAERDPALLRSTLADLCTSRSSTASGFLTSRLSSSTLPPELRIAWAQRLAQLSAARPFLAAERPRGTIRRESDGGTVLTWNGVDPASGTRIEWTEIPEMRELPGEWSFRDRHAIATPAGSVPIDLDPGVRVAVRLARRSDVLAIDVVSPWVRL